MAIRKAYKFMVDRKVHLFFWLCKKKTIILTMSITREAELEVPKKTLVKEQKLRIRYPHEAGKHRWKERSIARLLKTKI